MTMGTRTGFPMEDPLTAFSALNLLRNYNQFLGSTGSPSIPTDVEVGETVHNSQKVLTRPGTNLVQVYHHYSCGTSVGDFSHGDSSRPGNFSFPPSIGAFQPYLHYPLPPSSPLTDFKSRQPFLTGSSIYSRRPRGEKKPIPDDQKDDRYYERRKRNNQAAKKSRDARKLREDQIALRATLLEHENAILRAQLLTLREETQSLRQLILTQKRIPGKDLPAFSKKEDSLEGSCLKNVKKWESETDFCIKDLNNSVE